MDRFKKFQKALRSSQTDAENLIWYHLRNNGLAGFKFRRQHQLQGYIVDFVCLEKKLIIELDGGQHSEQEAYDHHRTEQLQKDGFQVLRFWNDEVVKQIKDVLSVIHNTLINNHRV